MKNSPINESSNKEIELRYSFIANAKFAKEFLKNSITTEVAYLAPFSGSKSNTTCRFRRRGGKSTITCKTTDGKNASFIERYEDEFEISNEAFEAYTEKLPIMKFRFYKDWFGREFKSFSDSSTGYLRILVEKEFDHLPTVNERNEFVNSLMELGSELTEITATNAVTMLQLYNDFLKEKHYI